MATNGDGLALRGDRLYVVRNQNKLVAVLNLSNLGGDHPAAALVGEITSPTRTEQPGRADDGDVRARQAVGGQRPVWGRRPRNGRLLDHAPADIAVGACPLFPEPAGSSGGSRSVHV